LRQKLLELIKEPEIREALSRIVKFEEETEQKYKADPLYAGLNHTPAWGLMDIPVEWHIVKRLIFAGVVRKLAKKWYVLSDRATVKEVLNEYQKYEAIKEKPVTFTQTATPPDDLFVPIVGFDDIKQLFRKSLKSEKPVHILLVGPPACAKTLFLLEISRLPGAFYALGGSTTKVGLIDQLFDLQPRYLLLDEADKMRPEDYAALLSLMETGIIKETKHDKQREARLNTRVYGAANTTKGIPSEVLSRFWVLNIPPYTDSQFRQIAEEVLVIREGVDRQLARYIATKLTLAGSRDIRDVVRIGRLAKNQADVDWLVELMRKYGG